MVLERAGGVGGKHQVFLLLALLTLEGVRLARMILSQRSVCGPPNGYTVPIRKSLYVFGDRSVQRFLHEDWVQFELPVGHAHQVKDGVDASRRGANAGRLIGVPSDDFRARSDAKFFSVSARIGRPLDTGDASPKRGGDASADRARRAE